MSQSAALQQDEQSQNISSSLEFTIDRSLLLKSLGHVQSVVEKRNTIPILSNVKIEAFDNILSLTATDMDIAVTEQIDTQVATEGALTVPAHTFYDIIRKLPDGAQVQIKGDADKTGKVKINSGSCNFSLSCLPVTEYPVMDNSDLGETFALTSAELLALIDKTKFAISTEETRYYLNGIFLHTKANEEGLKLLCSVATDGHRLAKVELEAPEGVQDIEGVIIPRKTIIELRKLIEDSECDIEIALSDTKISFICDNAVLLSKLIDGTFPEYDKVIPYGNDKVMEIRTDLFIKAVDRVSTITSDKTRAIKLIAQEGAVVLSAVNEENSTAKEEVEASYSEAEIEIGLNSRYILEMASSIEGDTMELIFADGSAPVLVKDTADACALYVIMPMRI